MTSALPLALTAFQSTFGLVIVFFIIFPALLHVLIGVTVSQVFGERDANERHRSGRED